MATYKVQAPDGKMITLEGPDGASQADVIAQAQTLYQPTAARAPAPASQTPQRLSQTQAKAAWDAGSADLERQIANYTPAQKSRARDLFFKNPEIVKLREAAARPISEAKREGRIAVSQLPENRAKRVQGFRNVLQTLAPLTGPMLAQDDDTLAAEGAGFIRGAFGLPERIAAGVEYLVDNPGGNNSYSNILQTLRGQVDADRKRSLAGDIAGQVGAGIAMGGPLAEGAQAALGASKLAPVAARIAAAAPKTSRVAAASAAGGVGGAAQALGEGSDVGTGAALGAVGGPVLLGLGKVAGYVLRPVGDLLGLPNAGQILRRFTTATEDDMRRAADEYRAATGAEPTLYELLPLADRNKIAKNVVGSSPAVSERAAGAVRARVANVGPEMGRNVETATGTRRAQILQQMQQDLATARGGVPDPADAGMAAAASRSPVDLEGMRAAEASTTMAPVENMPVADTLTDLLPRSLHRDPETGEVSEVFSDPEMNALLSRAAGTLRLRLSPEDPNAAVAGLSVNDITRLIDKLGDVHPASPDFLTAQRAVNHLLDEMPPEARALTDQMRTAYAARSRMLEGMGEGARTRTRESVPVESRSQGQTVANAFDTPEGETGRFLGQTNALGREFSGQPRDVLHTAGQIAESGQTQAAIRGNLGPEAADAITAAAEAQARGVRNLASIGRETGKEADSLDLEDLGRMVLALNPASMPTTKLFALSRLTTLTRMPENKARAIVDMLFSQDPAMTNRAIGLLNNAGQVGRAFLSDMRKALNIGARGATAAQGMSTDQGGEDMNFIPEAQAGEISGDFPDPEETGEATADDEGAETDVPYGRSVIEELFPEAHITDDVRDPGSALGRKNPSSWHVNSDQAVDVRPIPGMEFEDFIATIKDAGYDIIEAIDEVKHPSGHATGPHWHVVIA